MGILSSKTHLTLDNNYRSIEQTSEDNPNLANTSHYFMDKFEDADFSKLDDLLIDILSFVSADDLIYNCRLVCKEWKEIIDGHSVWKIKCQREKKNIPTVLLNKIPKHYYRKIFVFNPYGRNLIRNACGKGELEGWEIRSNGGDGFKVEEPPQGADPVPVEVGSQSCFATSYGLCTKYQQVYLMENGISKEILQLETTKIEVGEWYAARFDCAAKYKLSVALISLENGVEANLLPERFFKHSYTEEQWVGKQWYKVSHTFKNIGDVSSVCFEHCAQDKQFWAGHFGMKMTGSYVKVIA
ncbi:hypothetical protein JTE90_029353 [Oedothorax gibbosus]|uniref:FBA domain-containing protein n=1 Tax=Oedothorax gibbosus TaxID=931172 RepID=A0AAV6UG70_9ARAC|nr:hypothetical protein JTE90_029353 [Oedothorax gibbosus]